MKLLNFKIMLCAPLYRVESCAENLARGMLTVSGNFLQAYLYVFCLEIVRPKFAINNSIS